MERFILDGAGSMWNKGGHFTMKTGSEEHNANEKDEQMEEPPCDDDYVRLDADTWPVYFLLRPITVVMALALKSLPLSLVILVRNLPPVTY
jgi:hypothetical protein